ncbi:hypothetical protein G1K92_13240 [Tenacibaculum finnmarkense]|nr:hypothetical protein [Tenacibaculum finnmarkense]
MKLEKSILVNQKESEVKILEKIKEEKRLLNSFEKNYLAPTILKILDFEKNKIDLDVDAYKMPDLKVENENKILKKKLETAKEFIEKKDEIILKLENKKVNSLLPEEGLKTIELIRDNYKLDTSPMGRKRVVLNLDPEIFFKLFKIIE